jgi:hypothetical protein
MSEYDSRSLILACDFRVDDVDRMWKWLDEHEQPLASIGAHHVALCSAGFGAYPTQFIGRFVHLMSVGERV